MSENPELNENQSASEQAAQDEIQRCLKAEILEMEKYKWCLGERLQRDPLQDRTLNDIYCEWIDKYAADFRKDWESRKPRENCKN